MKTKIEETEYFESIIPKEHFTSLISPGESFELIINALALVWTPFALYYTMYLLFESEDARVDYLLFESEGVRVDYLFIS